MPTNPNKPNPEGKTEISKVIAIAEQLKKLSDKPNGRLPDSSAGWNNA